MKKYWQSLDDLAAGPSPDKFQDIPAIISEISDPVTRRRFLSLMGASMALAGFVGCRRPLEHIVPYVKAPEEIVPGVANYYATTMPFGNNAYGLVVESHEGRPTKIEGNKNHPSTLGRSNPFIQASVLSLYDPDRSQVVTHNGAESTWEDFISFWREQSPALSANGGAGLTILCGPFSSPTLARLKDQFLKTYPKAKWGTYEPVSDENIYEGIKLASGKAYQPVYHFEKAKVILSLDSDFLYSESDSIRNAKGFTDGRRIKSEHDDMNRLYVAESAYTITGAMADHRLAIPSSDIGYFAIAVAKELKRQGLTLPDSEPLDNFNRGNFDNNWIRVVASDLLDAKGKSLILAGRNQPPQVHALVFALNSALGNIGKSVGYRYIYDDTHSSLSDLSSLCDDLKRGEISTLIILGGNPVYNTSSDLAFGDLLKNVKHTIHLSEYADETSNLCQWHLPETHYLEGWGDARSIDGTLSVIQPLIAPLYDGRSLVEIINLITNGQEARGYDLVRDVWKSILWPVNYERDRQRLLNDGLYWENPSPEEVPRVNNKAIFYQATLRSIDNRLGINNLEINFRPSPTLYDGRYANNAWLQELP
ncbi:MAG TPA: molybdopterin oxidoreductase, partial [candidate division Zixibacteria bacterium]|nr:molybdopterin oxidoreductase [candidate division Zixibacteria bacterium]